MILKAQASDWLLHIYFVPVVTQESEVYDNVIHQSYEL